MLTHFIGYFPILYNTIIAGHLDDVKKLDGIGIASTFISIFVGPIVLGLNRAQDTLTSTAYGKGDLRLCGVYLNRGIAI